MLTRITHEEEVMRGKGIAALGLTAALAAGCATSGDVESLDARLAGVEARVGALEERFSGVEAKAAAAERAAAQAAGEARAASQRADDAAWRAEAMFKKTVSK